MASPSHLQANLLLAGLPAAEQARLVPDLEFLNLKPGDVLYESGVPMRHLYFPTSAVVSLLLLTEEGDSTELALVGREGVVGVGLFMGGGSTPSRAVAQIEGGTLRLPLAALSREFHLDGPLQHVLLRFTQALIAQICQTAVCNRHHRLEEQLCRWLLLSLDRVDSDELHVTHQVIADMLGVRREGVTAAATNLQHVGCIRYSRGLIKVTDRKDLERRACECYAVVSREYSRLLQQAAYLR